MVHLCDRCERETTGITVKCPACGGTFCEWCADDMIDRKVDLCVGCAREEEKDASLRDV